MKTAEPPTPTAEDLEAFRDDPLTALPRLFTTYGDPFQIPTQIGPMVMTANPDNCERVMKGHNSRGPLHRRTEPTQGAGITILTGEPWRRTRSMVSPLFTHRHLKELSALIAEGASDGLDRLDEFAGTGETVDLMEFMPKVTMGVLMHAMFSNSLQQGEVDAMISDYAHISAWKAGLIKTAFEPDGAPVPHEDEGRQALGRIDAIIYRIIAERRNGVTRNDLLQLLIDSEYEEDGSKLSDEEVRNNTTTLFIAGFDTTSFGLCWTLAAALTSDRWDSMVECADQISGRLPTLDDYPRLALLKAAFDEGLRLQGHPLIPRELATDEIVGEYTVPAGTMVTMSTWVMHRDPALWEAPEEFRPERYLDAEKAERSRWQSLPFGGGPRVCIGINFAYMEATYVLGLLLSRYRLELDPDWKLKPTYVFNVILDGGLPATIKRR